jgi:hypothetical protein
VQLVQYVCCDVGEGPAFTLADPLCERDPEHGGAGLRRQGGRRLADASPAQGLGDRCGDARELVQLALPERGILVDHGLPHTRVRAALVGEERSRRVKRGGDDLERGCVRRRGVHPVDERLKELFLAVEQHLALVAEVTEEGALGQPDGLRDFRGSRLLEPAGGEQLERRCLQALPGTRLPAHHDLESSDDSDCRTGVW